MPKITVLCLSAFPTTQAVSPCNCGDATAHTSLPSVSATGTLPPSEKLVNKNSYKFPFNYNQVHFILFYK